MRDIGTLGEIIVSRWLELQNYDLLQQSWCCRWGEIDIIAQDRENKTIAFVEVKTRNKNSWDEGGLLAVDSTKQGKIIKTASMFLAKHPNLAELPCRFDVALVSYDKCLGPRRKDAEKEKDLKDIVAIEIGESVDVSQYQLTIENYLHSAFDS